MTNDEGSTVRGKPRVYCQGVTSWYVIGTDDTHEAAALLRAGTSVDRWGGSFPGMFARRQGRWTSVDRKPSRSAPKDARTGVVFTACHDGSAACGEPLHPRLPEGGNRNER